MDQHPLGWHRLAESTTTMKFLVVLTLLGLAAAKPQLLLPYASPWLTPNIKVAEDAPVINTYTASYPYSGFPFVRSALPYNYNFPYTFSPFVTAAKPAAVEASRKKRSADPEPEADPAFAYSAINYPVAGLPTAGINYQYSGIPAAVSTYTYPQTIPYTGVTPYAGVNPLTGFHPFTGISPYSTFPYSSVVRSKRSADPEADPQLLTTGFTGFTYPAVNTRTFPTTFTGYPTTYTNSYPTTYTNSYPFHHGTYPFVTGYGK